MKCGACGGIGHMHTNKECPMYNKGGSADPVQVAMTEEQEEEEERNWPVADEDLINVEGTKITVSKVIFERWVEEAGAVQVWMLWQILSRLFGRLVREAAQICDTVKALMQDHLVERLLLLKDHFSRSLTLYHHYLSFNCECLGAPQMISQSFPL